ncbi:MAG: prolipoprotein diacylglyceryl transferase [Prevotellaceae bacterium]|jgi:prolipoprotein diacylglyceryl transferase|nr:prolipoprotein diacylglyceryl transferase [Prevotellaceae bacterium]
MTSLFITWNPDPEIFRIFGIPVRYYGLLWVVGIALSAYVVHYIYRDKKIGEEKFEPLFFYCFFGILLGARLGHCLFYNEHGYYFSNFYTTLEVFLPFRHDAAGWHWTGYAGLASHGGTAGLIVSLWLYCRKYKMHFMDVLDIMGVAAPVCACFIRLANLMNQEIVGDATTVPWAFVFPHVDMQPRHPAQLYEALAYLLIFGMMLYLYKTRGKTLRRGFFFGLCIASIFTFRFFIEFIKMEQVDFEKNMVLDMGQWLSIPFILAGLYFMFGYGRKRG